MANEQKREQGAGELSRAEQCIQHLSGGGEVWRRVGNERFFYKMKDGELVCRVNEVGGWHLSYMSIERLAKETFEMTRTPDSERIEELGTETRQGLSDECNRLNAECNALHAKNAELEKEVEKLKAMHQSDITANAELLASRDHERQEVERLRESNGIKDHHIAGIVNDVTTSMKVFTGAGQIRDVVSRVVCRYLDKHHLRASTPAKAETKAITPMVICGTCGKLHPDTNEYHEANAGMCSCNALFIRMEWATNAQIDAAKDGES